jgi:hypothetical protein
MKTIPALVRGVGTDVGAADAVVEAFFVVVGSAGVVAEGAAVVAGAFVSDGTAVVAVFFFVVVSGADFGLVVVFVVLAAVFTAFGAAAGPGAAAPFFVIADLIVVVGAALANVTDRNNPLSVTARATGIRFDREGIIRTDYRTSEGRPRISGYSPGHSPWLPLNLQVFRT